MALANNKSVTLRVTVVNLIATLVTHVKPTVALTLLEEIVVGDVND